MKIYTDSIHKIAYSTDASIYREVPQGVAYPESVDDVRELIRLARERGTCLIPRAGGTSIAGQVVGGGIVVDISRHFNHILEINAEERWAWVEPGVVRDEMNIALKPYGLFFSPETSTSNRCCIGGMVGNNSCGTHSLVYGSTRHHVLQLKGLLSDGSSFDTAVRGDGALERSIYAQLEGWRCDREVVRLIEAGYPDRSLRRRSCGYAIDEALGLDVPTVIPSDPPVIPSTFPVIPSDPTVIPSEAKESIDLCKLLCGSEGTLAFITEIKVSLDPLPPKEGMVLCAHCPTLEAAFEANLVALRHGPVAVELMDGRILELGKDNIEAQRDRFFVEGDPAALLIAEFRGPEMGASSDALEAELAQAGLAYTCTRVYGAEVARVWALRKAGLGVLSGMKGDAKPVGVIEDTAVAPERLPAYMADFRAMLAELGLDCVFYGHISTGELHLRPILNLKDAEGRRLFRAVAEETARLVRKHRGSLSGEHGDGRLRGEFIPLMYGEECYRLMKEVKRCWDPYNVFNMNKIVDTPGMDEWLRFEQGQRYVIEDAETVFNWRAAFDECKVAGVSGVRSQAHALMCSIEQCNGAGDCRKSNLIGGTMCPAFKSTRDELNTTRARANVLRECLTRGGGFTSPEVKEILDSCLACKGCRAECPSNVDMTRIRAEVLQQIHDREGTPLRSFAVARMAAVERLGHLVRPLYNFFAGWGPSAALLKRILRFAAERRIPALSRNTLRQLLRRDGFASVHPSRPTHSSCPSEPLSCHSERSEGIYPTTPRRVYLFADEFTNYQEAELGLTFARLLRRLGYDVVVPKHVESGRAAISKGCLKLARRFAVRNVSLLSGVVTDEAPLVGIEPSCILSFRDEYPDLVPAGMRPAAKALAANCLLFDEFIMREVSSGRITAEAFRDNPVEVWLHGHCHQKALVGVDKTAAALRLLPGATVHVIPSGCCGMAGSFGYEKEHYRRSLEIGEMVLFPAVRRALHLSSTPTGATPSSPSPAPTGSSATSSSPSPAPIGPSATSSCHPEPPSCHPERSEGSVPAVIVAPGTSCRQQILDGTGVRAVHPVELLYSWLR